jgi:hypothetical protein
LEGLLGSISKSAGAAKASVASQGESTFGFSFGEPSSSTTNGFGSLPTASTTNGFGNLFGSSNSTTTATTTTPTNAFGVLPVATTNVLSVKRKVKPAAVDEEAATKKARA